MIDHSLVTGFTMFIRRSFDMTCFGISTYHRHEPPLQFAYRRMLIPGTNVPPCMVARGRQPSLPSDLERFELGGALPTLPALSDHFKVLTGHMKLASASP